ANVSGEVRVATLTGDSLVWTPLNTDMPEGRLHQPLDALYTACLDPIMILRGTAAPVGTYLLDEGLFTQGLADAAPERLFVADLGSTVALVWDETSGNIDTHLKMLEVSSVDWSARVLRDLGSINFGVAPGQGAEGLQVVFNRF